MNWSRVDLCFLKFAWCTLTVILDFKNMQHLEMNPFAWPTWGYSFRWCYRISDFRTVSRSVINLKQFIHQWLSFIIQVCCWFYPLNAKFQASLEKLMWWWWHSGWQLREHHDNTWNNNWFRDYPKLLCFWNDTLK